jgi:hypothetical protein
MSDFVETVNDISLAEADELFAVVRASLRGLDEHSRNQLRVRGRKGLQISYDSHWQPFLGYTIGWNNGSRVGLRGESKVLSSVRRWLR